MEKASRIGNTRQLFRLIRETGGRRQIISETISEKNGTIISSQDRRLERWKEHYEEQFNLPTATLNLPNIQHLPEWDIDTGPPSLTEVTKAVTNLKLGKAAGPDGMTPEVFKYGGDSLLSALTEVLGSVWESEEVPSGWCKSLIIPIYKKGDKSSCDNHRGISLTNIVSKVLGSIIMRRLSGAREAQTRESQAGFRPGRGCIDHIFTLRQILEHRHSYRRPTVIIFLDLKAAFDSVDREVLWRCLAVKGIPRKYIALIKALYSYSYSQVRAYGELSSELMTTSGVRQGCPLSPFLFNFIIDVLMDLTLGDFSDSGIDLLPGNNLVDLEYADDIVLLGEDADEMQSLLNTLSRNLRMFGMRFAPAKCKMMLQDWTTSTPSLKIGSEVVEHVDRFTYLGSTISQCQRVDL
uniref:Reverse transcriptase domain-containing protein n=1 Tax=Trichobilharzia regenti TaxID=157069 RepID=A0AA85JIK6_TRIRE|nr:unnamed protein product [Trichobilharzia regenti]